ncbi:MAG: tRNA threonylcarbamoyladenosine dehydratase [Clostridia bacterium]|jgi:tRNA A37 threonylcarbamoyladenosine dehydratase|nr:tRNA threonylcarbamoyladenosine dehydratase [Clostridia bacterium]
MEKFSRTEMLIGSSAIQELKKSKIAIFGLGGVGSYVLEALVRSGIENFVLIDHDVISTSNINRQILATTQTIGKDKIEIAKKRALEINPNCKIETYKTFYMPNIKEEILDTSINYIVDAIDTITAKIELVVKAKQIDVPIISSMGTGNKLDPTKFEIEDIYNTTTCPLAKIMRKELKKRGIEKLKVLYSKEEPIKIKQINLLEKEKNIVSKKQVPASISFVPSVAGLIIAGEVIKDIIKNV